MRCCSAATWSWRRRELVKFYRLRYQIEFNFRDAKQFWGLEDWMNVTATAVSHAASLSLLMVSVSHCLLERLRTRPGAHPKAGVLDLKAYWRGRHYAQATLKWLVHKPTPALRELIIHHGGHTGRYPLAKHTATFSLNWRRY